MLLAAGYAPAYEQRELDDPEMTPVGDAIQQVLDGHDPYPAAVVDRPWEIVAANRGLQALIAGVAPELLEPPVNAMRVALHPDGMAPRILNLGEWRSHLLDRLRRQLELTGDPAVKMLLDEVSAYPHPENGGGHSGNEVFVPLRLRAEAGELEFFGTIATFGTAVDITVAELSIESFFPADQRTVDYLRALP